MLCRTFLQGFEDTSNEALKARLCWVVRMVRGLLGLLGSFPSSPFPWPPMPFSGLMSSSSSSLFSANGATSTELNWLYPEVSHSLLMNNFLFFSIEGDSHKRNQRRHMCFWYFVINLLLKEKDTCMIRLTGVSCEICTFVMELDAASRVIYCAQLCPIYTKSISDKATTSRATWKRKQEHMWEMHLPWHSTMVQLWACNNDSSHMDRLVFTVSLRLLQPCSMKIDAIFNICSKVSLIQNLMTF